MENRSSIDRLALAASQNIKERDFWLEQLSGDPVKTRFPYDFVYKNEDRQKHDMARMELSFPGETLEKIKKLSKGVDIKLHIILATGLVILLSKYTDDDKNDILLGSPILKQAIVGDFINTVLVFRTRMPLDIAFKDLLIQVRETIIKANENQNYPIELLPEQLELTVPPGEFPFVDVAIMLENLHDKNYIRHVDYSMLFSFLSSGDGAAGTIEYNPALYHESTIERIAHHYINVLDQVLTDVNIPISHIEIMADRERKQILFDFNDTYPAAGRPQYGTLDEWFARQVKKTPDNIAVVGQNLALYDDMPGRQTAVERSHRAEAETGPDILQAESQVIRTLRLHRCAVSYKELDAAANRLSYRLQEKGAQIGDIAAIIVHPAVEMIVGLLAIIKAGCAYLPIDTDYPMERIDFILRDSGAGILLTRRRLYGQVGNSGGWNGEIVFLDEVERDLPTPPDYRSTPVLPGNPAYIIYTSGTTGKPKGVPVEHRNVTANLHAFFQEFAVDEKDAVIQLASYAFDAFIEEVFPLLLSGGRIFIPHVLEMMDMAVLSRLILEQLISIIDCTPLLINELNHTNTYNFLKYVRIIISGGDVLKSNYVDNLIKIKNIKIYNTYGPTESTICAAYYHCKNRETHAPAGFPIGKPIAGYQIYILDAALRPIPIGVGGELCVAGPGVTRGYLNRPELTQEKFVQGGSFRENHPPAPPAKAFDKSFLEVQGPRRGHPLSTALSSRDIIEYPQTEHYTLNAPPRSGVFQKSPLVAEGNYLYKTGDLARWLPDGNIEFSGRIDAQVKIRGFRIEPGEVERRLLEHNGIAQTAAAAITDKKGEKALCAYIVFKPAAHPAAEKIPDHAELREFLSHKLPDYMIPTYFVQMERLPLTANGKLDRKKLPLPEIKISQNYIAPSTDYEKITAQTWQEVLKLEKVGIHDNFFEIGGNSMDIIRVNSLLKDNLKMDIPIVAMFKYPTLHKFSEYLTALQTGETIDREQHETFRQPVAAPQDRPASHEIAVIGMAGRFPGAKNIDEFWENLKNGVEAISFFSAMELAAEGMDAAALENPAYVKARGMFENKEYFDAAFFGYSPRDAEVMDPQLRFFHQCAWEALENAGYNPYSYDGMIGLYAGSTNNFHWESLAMLAGKSDSIGGFVSAQLTNKDFLCTRISYKLNLRGPALVVQSACSTSLAAVHLACRALLNGECHIAMAGGVTILGAKKSGYLFQEGMVMSPDGHCRAFDARAKGTVGGEGVGIVVLKPLSNAIADRDNIYAVIKGSAIDNDGSDKVGFAAPSVAGQLGVIKAALNIARVAPESITYIETHGTGTSLGDPIEIEALKLAFNSAKRDYCAVGSVKTNIGHLDSAAGAASFIKTVLALKQRRIPPSLFFENPNTAIHFEDTPFYVNTGLKDWTLPAGGDFPRRAAINSFAIGGTNVHIILEEAPEVPPRDTARQYHLFLLSARTPTALETMTRNLADYFKTLPPDKNQPTKFYDCHLADAAYTLQVGRQAFPQRRMLVGTAIEMNEFIDYLTFPYYYQVDTYSMPEENRPPRLIFIFPAPDSMYTNMGLELYNCEPIFRGEMDRCFEIMKSLTAVDLKEVLYPRSPASTIPGQTDRTGVDEILMFIFGYALAQLLLHWGIQPTAMIGRGVGEYTAAALAGVFSLEDALQLVMNRGKTMPQVGLNPPKIPYISNMTGTWITAEQAADPAYWSALNQTTERFADGLAELLKQPDSVFVEFGPGEAPAAFPREYEAQSPNQIILNLVRRPREKISDFRLLLSQLGRLWLQGVNINGAEFYQGEKRRRIPLPTYPFESRPYWLTVTDAALTSFAARFKVDLKQARADFPGWFYTPVWTQAIMEIPAGKPQHKTGKQATYTWLFFMDDSGIGALLVNMLREKGHSVLEVRRGAAFTRSTPKHPDSAAQIGTGRGAVPYSYTINPRQLEDYRQLFQDKMLLDKLPSRIVHLWNIGGDVQTADTLQARLKGFDEAQYKGFYSILFIAALAPRLIRNAGGSAEIHIDVVGSGIRDVTGEEFLSPHKATLSGLLKVIPQENPGLYCRSIDIIPPEPHSPGEIDLANRLLDIILEPHLEPMLALRGHFRWVETYTQLRLEETPIERLPLKEKGVYLITGGLGNIGFTLAQYLAREFSARLVLTGRSPCPRGKKEAEDPADPIAAKIRKIKELEALGGEVLVFQADVSNLEQMQKLISQVEKKWRKIDGVIHAAGVVKGESFNVLENLGEKECAQQFQAKAYGAMTLEYIFQDKELDFCWLMSSLSSVLGGLTYGAYAAANSFMDVFSIKHNRENRRPWKCVNWDLLPANESVQAFARILSLTRIHRTAVTNGGDLQDRLDRWIKLEELRPDIEQLEAEAAGSEEEHTALPLRPRPNLSTPYRAPRNQLENTITAIWKRVFGFEQIGIDDDFFELGGDSLKLVKVTTDLQAVCNINFALTQAFAAATIKKIADFIRADQFKQSGDKAMMLFNQPKPISIFCFPPGAAYGLIYRKFATLLDEYAVYAFNYLDDCDLIETYISEMLKVQPEGPYILLGFSAGGKVALRTANVLEERGKQVSLIIMVDCQFEIIRDKDDFIKRTEAIYADLKSTLFEIGAVEMFEQAVQRIRNYYLFFSGLRDLKPTDAAIHFIKSENVDKDDVEEDETGWEKYANNRLTLYNGFGEHYLMMAPKFIHKNVQIVKKIIETVK